MKKIFYTLVGAALLLCGCSTAADEEEMQGGSTEMHFAVQHPHASRATALGFEAQDAMGVYVTHYTGETAPHLLYTGNYANNVQTIFDGAAWKPAFPIYWAPGKFDVYAYYPYAEPYSTENYKFSVALDQSTPETPEALGGYEQSDFLWAKATGVSQMDQVPLTFSHRLSKLTVRLKKGPLYEGAFPDDMIVKVHSTVTDATIDLATGFATKDGRAPQHSITAHKVAVDHYEAIVIPQRLENKVPLVEVITQGVSYIVDSRFVFKMGTEHTYTVTLNGNPDQIKIEIGGEIENNWQ